MSKIQELLPDSEFLKKNLCSSEIPTEAYLNYGYALLAIAGRRRGFRIRTSLVSKSSTLG